jgi:hypothetical protein
MRRFTRSDLPSSHPAAIRCETCRILRTSALCRPVALSCGGTHCDVLMRRLASRRVRDDGLRRLALRRAHVSLPADHGAFRALHRALHHERIVHCTRRRAPPGRQLHECTPRRVRRLRCDTHTGSPPLRLRTCRAAHDPQCRLLRDKRPCAPRTVAGVNLLLLGVVPARSRHARSRGSA